MNNVLQFKRKESNENLEKKETISGSVRYKLFQVMDGFQENLPILHQITQYVYHERMLDWLVKNKLTGKRFNEFYLYECKGSILSLGAFIIGRINSLEKGRPIYAHRDFKVD